MKMVLPQQKYIVREEVERTSSDRFEGCYETKIKLVYFQRHELDL